MSPPERARRPRIAAGLMAGPAVTSAATLAGACAEAGSPGPLAGPASLVVRNAALATLEVGKGADRVVADHDLFALPPAELREARVRVTVVGGEVVFEER